MKISPKLQWGVERAHRHRREVIQDRLDSDQNPPLQDYDYHVTVSVSSVYLLLHNCHWHLVWFLSSSWF